MDNYSKSNSIENVSLKRFSSKEYKNLWAAPESIQERAKAAQKLCDYLCAKFKIVPAKVIVTNRAQPQCASHPLFPQKFGMAATGALRFRLLRQRYHKEGFL